MKKFFIISLFIINCFASDKPEEKEIPLLLKKNCLIPHGPKEADTNDDSSDPYENFFKYETKEHTNDAIDFFINLFESNQHKLNKNNDK